jgi:hypothetical protein
MKVEKEEIAKFSEYFDFDLLSPFQKKAHKRTVGKLLCIADVHAPYQHKVLGDIIVQNYDACKLFIAGDWFDLLSKTFFRKTADIDFRKEFRKAYILLKETCRHFDDVYFLVANHDQRFTKHIFDNVPPDILAFCRTSLVEDLIALIPNLHIVNHNMKGRNVGYIYNYKNVVFTHIEKSNIDITKTAQEINKEFMHRWGDFLELPKYDILIQAHNHSSGRVRVGGKIICQIPCLVDIAQPAFDYVFNGKMKGNPPALGYITMMESDGVVLRESVRVHDVFER